MVADADVITELLSGLDSSRPPALAHACLATLDILSAEPACTEALLHCGWLDAVTTCLESPDAMVRRWAERTLCSLYVATGRLSSE